MSNTPKVHYVPEKKPSSTEFLSKIDQVIETQLDKIGIPDFSALDTLLQQDLSLLNADNFCSSFTQVKARAEKLQEFADFVASRCNEIEEELKMKMVHAGITAIEGKEMEITVNSEPCVVVDKVKFTDVFLKKNAKYIKTSTKVKHRISKTALGPDLDILDFDWARRGVNHHIHFKAKGKK